MHKISISYLHVEVNMLNYVAAVFVLFFCVDVYYFLRMLVVLVVAATRPKRPGIRSIRVLLYRDALKVGPQAV